MKLEQDGKEYSSITELSKADADALIKKAADAKLILHAAISKHTAKLFATPFAKVARIGDRKCKTALRPITIETAKDLKLFPDATIESYLAIDPTQYPDTHPFADHLYVLDVPQTITREQVYFRCDDEDAKIETAPVKSESTPATGVADWKDEARAIADKLALERYERGEREITARNICDAVQLELAKDYTTHGTRGQRSAGNIRNVALKGWKFIPPTGTNGTSGTKK